MATYVFGLDASTRGVSYNVPLQIKAIPSLPNLFLHNYLNLIIYVIIFCRKLKIIISYGYLLSNSIFLISSRNIELNHGPMPNLLHTHYAIHERINKNYFIPNTIKASTKSQAYSQNICSFVWPYTCSIWKHNHNIVQSLHLYINNHNPPTSETTILIHYCFNP